MILSTRDLDVLAVLSFHVRVLTLSQIAATWWRATSVGEKNAGRRLAQLRTTLWLQRERLWAQPFLPLHAPVHCWDLGDAEPHPGRIAWKLRMRWSGNPRKMLVWFATRRGVRHFGGTTPGQIKNRCQLTHDLHVASVYLLYRRHWPALAAQWLGEDGLAPERRGQKLPDAVLVDQDGRPWRAIEFGGSYSARRVAAFHADCAARNLPYELW